MDVYIPLFHVVFIEFVILFGVLPGSSTYPQEIHGIKQVCSDRLQFFMIPFFEALKIINCPSVRIINASCFLLF
ncbi:MAG: hypothetical protein JWR87_3684 [Segetibacter sp.]|jgi:hypothetical protein|nr:hypothetical protein [Segetibacter sp.]